MAKTKTGDIEMKDEAKDYVLLCRVKNADGTYMEAGETISLTDKQVVSYENLVRDPSEVVYGDDSERVQTLESQVAVLQSNLDAATRDLEAANAMTKETDDALQATKAELVEASKPVEVPKGTKA